MALVSILILLELPFDLNTVPVRDGLKRFQSLFYWNCRLIYRAEVSRTPCKEFQSLFYWNCRLIYVTQLSDLSWNPCFNPYFIGIAV